MNVFRCVLKNRNIAKIVNQLERDREKTNLLDFGGVEVVRVLLSKTKNHAELEKMSWKIRMRFMMEC